MSEASMGLVRMVSGAVAPWNSMDADYPLGTHDSNVDSQAQINKCLSCWYPDCNNCVSNRSKDFYSVDENVIDMAQLEMCIKLGMNQKDTSALMNISKTSYYRAKRKLGLVKGR